MDDFRLLVCGGRTYAWHKEGKSAEEVERETQVLYTTLDAVWRAIGRPITLVEGEQRGADLVARRWAEERGHTVEGYPADWAKHGKAAGFIRNRQMLDEGKPQAVVAFPGGQGTKMMIELSRKAGLPLLEVK